MDLPEPLEVYDAFLADFSRLVDRPPDDREISSLKKYFTEERFEGISLTFEFDLVDIIDTDERLDHIVKYRTDHDDGTTFRATVCEEQFFGYVIVSTGERDTTGIINGTAEVSLVRTDSAWLIDAFTRISDHCNL